MRFGVLGLQGDVPEHRAALARLVGPASVVEVRRPSELEGIDGLLLPGGESTTLAKLLRDTELFAPLSARLAQGLPVLATCAGLILLAQRLEPGEGGDGPETLHALDVTVRRNDYGRQIESFEAPLQIPSLRGGAFPGIFIRAPRIVAIGPGVERFAYLGKEVVGVRAGSLWGLTFHPELSGDLRLHAAWLGSVRSTSAQRTKRNTATRSPSARLPARTASQ